VLNGVRKLEIPPPNPPPKGKGLGIGGKTDFDTIPFSPLEK